MELRPKSITIQVFWGVFWAGIALWLCHAVWLAVTAAFVLYQAHAALESAAEGVRVEQQRTTQASAAKREADLARRRLGPEHRCVNGTLVLVQGSTYTQLRAKCSGAYADVPLR